MEIPKKQGKSELAAAVALLLTCGDGEERAEVYGCAADRHSQAASTLSIPTVIFKEGFAFFHTFGSVQSSASSAP